MPGESYEIDFSRRVRELTEDFVGREWLFAEVEAFLAGEAERVLLIEGEPGAGKSAVAARLVQRGAASAHHFCVPHEAGTREPVTFVRSMSLKLVRAVPGFGRHLVEEAAARRVEAHVSVESARNAVIYGVYVDKLIVNARSAEEAFQVLLREPLKALADQGGGRVTLLVDSLDEAARLDRRPSIADLIASSRDLPEGVRWIVTSRPGGPIAERPGVRRIALDGAGQLEDAVAFVDAALSEPSLAAALARAGQDAGAFRRALLERGDARDRGNLLYLRYVLRQLREDAAAGRLLAPAEGLPAGLDAVYRELLDRPLQGRPKDERRRLVRPVLGVLAAAQEPLRAAAIERFSGVPGQDVSDVLEDLKELLDSAEEGGEPAHRLYHASFGDFLCDRSRNPGDWIDVAVYHRQIAERALGGSNWGGWGPYALRHAPTHLARAAALRRARGDEDEAHEITEHLVRLVLGADFGEAHARIIGDPAAHYRMVEEALRQAAEDATEGGLPLTVEAALGLVGVRRRQLSPARAFERARAGDLDGAERQIALLEVEPGWRRACLLIAAWLAAPRSAWAARALVDRVASAMQAGRPDEALTRLRDRVQADVEGRPWEVPPPPDPAPGEMERRVARLAGMKARLGLIHEGPGDAQERLPWDETPDVPGALRAAAAEMAALVGHAAARPGDPGQHARDYVAILASNAYVQYRNLYLLAALEPALRHPDRAWAQGMAVEAAMAALSPVRQASADALAVALLACQAAADPAARARLDGFSAEVARAAEARRANRGDIWGSFTRRLAVLGQAYHLLGDASAARASLSTAVGLRYGFAVLQTFASLCLAEALRATGAEASAVLGVLAAARRSAHNVQDPDYLARTNARYNALCARFWQDSTAGFAVEPAVAALTAQPSITLSAVSTASTARTALHRVGQRYEDRASRPGRPPLPEEVLNARTLRALAALHGAPLADLERLNPGCAPDEALPDGREVLLPDPGMAALAAARVAAEAMVDPAPASPAARARRIQRLVPIAAERSTVLDTVLARLLLAAHPLPAATLKRLTAAALAWRPPPREAGRTAKEDEPTAWAWLA